MANANAAKSIPWLSLANQHRPARSGQPTRVRRSESRETARESTRGSVGAPHRPIVVKSSAVWTFLGMTFSLLHRNPRQDSNLKTKGLDEVAGAKGSCSQGAEGLAPHLGLEHTRSGLHR